MPSPVPCPVTISLTVSCCAKINLSLAVGPPEPQTSDKPGFHRIASWFVGVDLCDEIVLRRRPSGPSTHQVLWAPDAPRQTPVDWPIDKDLGVRAHRLLEHAASRDLPVDMLIRKRIPVGGGLGGGSADAAGVLLGLCRIFDIGMSPADLRRLAERLGSDVAFFIDDVDPRPSQQPEDTLALAPRPAFVSGFGERLQRLSPRAPATGTVVLLIIPEFGCPTGPVYKAFDARPTRHVDEDRVRSLIAEAAGTGRVDSIRLFNDLAAPAGVVQPALESTLGSIRAALGPETPVHVTGSGSTMFALAPAEAGVRLRDLPVRVVSCRTI